jgi:uncharacterized protein (UPF0332 family)
MRDLDFLNKLKKEGKLEAVEPSFEISDSYAKKSGNCLKSAKILMKEKLFENSITEAYYSMYNIVLSLFYRCGIKCENHSAAIILLEKLFQLKKLRQELFQAKKERIDTQYYVGENACERAAREMIMKAEEFILNVKSHIGKLDSVLIEEINKKYKN